MDEEGNYILDEQGNTLKLTEDQLEQLRAINIVEEDNQQIKHNNYSKNYEQEPL